MSEISTVTNAQVSCASEPADAMLRRLFKAAEILATVKQPKNIPTEEAENPIENRPQHELRYRKD